MEDKILKIMQEVFQDENLNKNCAQTNCDKWDSINHLTLIVELEYGFNLEFEPEEIAEMKSFEKIKDIISSKL